jgi:hypothetical protein
MRPDFKDSGPKTKALHYPQDWCELKNEIKKSIKK